MGGIAGQQQVAVPHRLAHAAAERQHISRVYTDVATFDLTLDGVVVTATVGITVEELRSRLDVPLLVG